MPIHSATPPDLLYHYTNQLGLLGILRSKSIWATQAQYLNDGREMALCLDLTREYLRSRAEFSAGDEAGRLLRTLDDWVGRIDGPAVFVASFTERGDLLSQWRGYCRPGDGYSLGIPSAVIREAVQPMWQLVPCLYRHGEHLAAVEAHVESHRQRFQANRRAFPEEDAQRRMDSTGFEFALELMQLAPSLKDESFSEECEWRAISPRMNISDSGIRYRPGRHTIIPYLPLTLPQLASSPVTVTVGPTQYPGLSKSAVASLMQNENMQYELISESEVPYRDW